MLSISRNVRLSVCLSVCLFVWLFTFEVPFNGLFAPTSRSRMSNIFRDSESLGKSNGKKWSQIWTFLFENCQKSPRKKNDFFPSLFSLLRYRLMVFLPPFPEVGCPIFLEIRNPWGKVMERSGWHNMWTAPYVAEHGQDECLFLVSACLNTHKKHEGGNYANIWNLNSEADQHN